MGPKAVALLVALTAPATALAQSADAPPRWTISPRSGPAAEGWPRDPVPRFTIPPRGTSGIPLPQIGLPLPPHGLQPPQTDRREHGRRSRHGVFAPWPGVVYVVPQYVTSFTPPPDPAPAEPVVELPAPTGRLIVDVRPENALVYVDGYYAGIAGDFSAITGGGALESGVHRLDISAPGYEPTTLDIRIAPGQSITYRGTLKPVEKPSVEPSKPTIFYLIPGCYMGNVPPKDAGLPPTCDLSRVIEFQY